MKKIYLKPNSKSILVVGNTGVGKTTFTTFFAKKKFQGVLKRCVGETNSTLVERDIVFTSDSRYSDSMCIAVKKKDVIYDFESLYIDIVKSLVATIIKFKKARDVSDEEIYDFLSDELIRLVNRETNANAVLSILGQERVREFLDLILGIVFKHNLSLTQIAYLYNIAKNEISKNDDKDSSKKLGLKLKEVAEEFIDDIFKDGSVSCFCGINIELMNEELDDKFFEYFHAENKSVDGYYYRNITLDNQSDMEFVDAFFANNDIKKSKLSIEVFCEKIVIYTAINSNIETLIRIRDDSFKKVFYDNFAFLNNNSEDISLCIHDTMGLFHEAGDEEDNIDSLNEVLYSENYDAIVFLTSIFGDSNRKKSDRVFEKIIKSLNKEIPAFVVNNKLDLFVENEKNLSQKNASIDSWDLFLDSDDVGSILDKTYDVEDIIKKIDDRVKEEKELYEKLQVNKKVKLDLNVCATLFQVNSSIEKEIVLKHSPINLVKGLIETLVKCDKESENKFTLSFDKDYDDIYVKVDGEKIKKVWEEELKKSALNKHVLVSLTNININMGN